MFRDVFGEKTLWSRSMVSKKIETYRAQNLLGPRPIRPISGLRIQDSVQLLQEQLHDSMIFYEPCFAKTRANPHVYVCMFVRNIYIYIYLIHCFTSHANLINVWLHTIQQKQVAKAPQWWLPLGSTAAGSLEGPMLSSVPVQSISIPPCTQNLLCWIGSDHQKLPIHTTPLPSNSRPLIYHHQLVPLS